MRKAAGRRSVDASVPHYLNALRATLARCPIPLRALVGFAYLRFSIYELRFQEIRALTRGVAERMQSGIFENEGAVMKGKRRGTGLRLFTIFDLQSRRGTGGGLDKLHDAPLTFY